jgi:hypothetical protein
MRPGKIAVSRHFLYNSQTVCHTVPFAASRESITERHTFLVIWGQQFRELVSMT